MSFSESYNKDEFQRSFGMLVTLTFAFVSLGNLQEQTKQQQIFTANTENGSLGETGTSKSTSE